MKKFVAIILIGAVMLCTLTGCGFLPKRRDPRFEISASIMPVQATDKAGISSSDLEVSTSLLESCQQILKTDKVNAPVKEKYPDREYTAALSPVEETALLRLTIQTKERADLEEICRLLTQSLVSALGEELETEFKIVEFGQVLETC